MTNTELYALIGNPGSPRFNAMGTPVAARANCRSTANRTIKRIKLDNTGHPLMILPASESIITEQMLNSEDSRFFGGYMLNLERLSDNLIGFYLVQSQDEIDNLTLKTAALRDDSYVDWTPEYIGWVPIDTIQGIDLYQSAWDLSITA